LSKHSDCAKDLFKKGYNCSQAVFAAFCDETGLDLEDALKISSSFGGGMGRLREVCGAVTGMFMVAGMKYGYADPADQSKKYEHYALIQTMAKKFEEENGSIICRELLGLTLKHDLPLPEKRTESYYKKRPCAEFVAYAAQILDEYIENKNMEEKKC
jgi:C_GCAxxG_C_C family probable redox protein